MNAVTVSNSGRIGAHDWLLLGAMLVVGSLAGALANPSLYLATPLAMFLVYKGALRETQAQEQSDFFAHPALPPRARRAVDKAAAELPAGEPRSLLAAVVTQAVIFFQAHETSFRTAAEDRFMLEDVAELVESACTSAEELALLDAATRASKGTDDAARASRERFTASLSAAATVIRNLHFSVVGGGTVASDRLTELTADLREDADARSRAMAELAPLLEERRRRMTRV